MKKFKEFLENYDVYIDKPKVFKKADTDIEIEQSTEEEDSNEEIATRVEPG